jgi:uncharacterized repeat protein (TIGR01451 family)
MTSERASRSGPSAHGAAALLGALALLAAAAHALAQQGGALPPPAAPGGPPRLPDAPAPLPPQISAPGLGALPEPSPPSAKPVPAGRPVDPPEFSPSTAAPVTNANPGQAKPPRPPAFRLVGAKGQQSAAEKTQPNHAPPPPVAAPPAGTAQTPALALDVAEVPARSGQPVAYEIVLRNVGRTTARGARLEDELPLGARLVGARPLPAVQGQRLLWEVEEMPPGAERRFRVELMTAGAVSSRATVTVSASRAPLAPAPVAGGARLAVAVTGPARVTAGHMAAFEIRATNLGAAPLGRVALSAALPPGLEHLHGADIETAFDVLAAGETRQVRLDVVAAQPGRHEIQVAARADRGEQAAGRAVVTVAEDPVVSLRLVGPREALTETENEYRVEVTNRSAAAVSGLVLTAALPPGVDLIHADRGTFDSASRAVRWQLGPLAPGETRGAALRLLARNPGPALAWAAAQTDRGHEARLHQVLRFRAQAQPPAER